MENEQDGGVAEHALHGVDVFTIDMVDEHDKFHVLQ
jgi:hypothetical protein